MYGYSVLERVPLLRIVIPFVIGIIVQQQCEFYSEWKIAVLVAVLIILLSFQRISKSLYGLFVHISFFVLGYSVAHINISNGVQDLNGKQDLILKVHSFPVEKNKSYHLNCEVVGVWNDVSWRIIRYTNANLYLQKDKNAPILKPGDLLLLKAYVNPYVDSCHTGDSYIHYLEQNNVYYWIFAKSTAWEYMYNRPNLIDKFKIIRFSIIEYLNHAGLEKDKLALVAALALGDKTYLSEQVKSDFRMSGSLHILAVSGFHVALLASIIYLITSLLPSTIWGRVFRIIAVLTLIWFFALLTGMSPSVKRAAIMVSIIVLGRGFSLQTSIFNSLAGAALITLVFSPEDIFRVGFQLSYAAVIGIVYCFPRIARFYKVPNRLLKYFIDIMNVAFCAQIGTLGFVLLYFNQIPVYGLLSNIAIILEAYLIVISLLFVSFFGTIFPVLNDFVIQILDYSATLMLHTTHYIAQLPNSVYELEISKQSTVIYYVLLLCLMLATNFNKKKRQILYK